MVGIPGRSQACGTCKRRKKGCDLQRPACGQCRKASVHCDGYNLSLTVRFYNGPNKDIRGPIEGVKHRSQVQQSSVGQFLSRTTLGSKASIDLTRAGYELQLEGLFWELYVPKGLRPSLFEESSKALGGSLSVIRDLLPNSDLLRAALGAIALRLIAREKACEFGKEEGIKLHTNALNQMSRALKLKGNDDLETIGAARLFSFYEALFGNDWNCHKTQEKSWYTHQLGDLAILSSKKPSFFATGHAHRIFVDGRLTCALYAIKERKDTFLTRLEWMNDPWVNHEKSAKDLLIDLLLGLPSLYAEIDRMNADPIFANKHQYRVNIEMGISEVVRGLSAWSLKFGHHAESFPKYWKLPRAPTVKIITRAHLMTLYWAICILVHGVLHNTLQVDAKHIDIQPKYCCQRIIQCLPLFLHSSTGIFRQHLIPFPLITALGYLTSHSTVGLEDEINYLISLSQVPELASILYFINSLRGTAFADMLATQMRNLNETTV